MFVAEQDDPTTQYLQTPILYFGAELAIDDVDA